MNDRSPLTSGIDQLAEAIVAAMPRLDAIERDGGNRALSHAG